MVSLGSIATPVKPGNVEAAQKVADHYLAALPADLLPPWDFKAPGEIIRDSSAAAICAAGLFYLSEILKQVESERGAYYQKKALAMLENLNNLCATWDKPDQEGLLLEGTEHFPANRNVNTSLIYGDYYFLEALRLATENFKSQGNSRPPGDKIRRATITKP